MNRKVKGYITGGGALWILLVGASAAWNVNQNLDSQRQIYLDTARSAFGLIVTMREWNALQGGIYVPISDRVQPNPYLQDPNRDITTTTGLTLTKLNPAYMTRLIAEQASEKQGLNLHLISLTPFDPTICPKLGKS